MNPYDVFAFVGWLAVITGISMIYVPAGIIAGGITLLFLAYVGHTEKPDTEKAE